MEPLTCHVPGWDRQHRPLYRKQSTPAPTSVFAASATDHFDLQQLIAEAAPQIARAQRLGLLQFAAVADESGTTQIVD